MQPLSMPTYWDKGYRVLCSDNDLKQLGFTSDKLKITNSRLSKEQLLKLVKSSFEFRCPVKIERPTEFVMTGRCIIGGRYKGRDIKIRMLVTREDVIRVKEKYRKNNAHSILYIDRGLDSNYVKDYFQVHKKYLASDKVEFSVEDKDIAIIKNDRFIGLQDGITILNVSSKGKHCHVSLYVGDYRRKNFKNRSSIIGNFSDIKWDYNKDSEVAYIGDEGLIYPDNYGSTVLIGRFDTDISYKIICEVLVGCNDDFPYLDYNSKLSDNDILRNYETSVKWKDNIDKIVIRLGRDSKWVSNYVEVKYPQRDSVLSFKLRDETVAMLLNNTLVGLVCGETVLSVLLDGVVRQRIKVIVTK